jgi:hypothetical protein
MSPSSSERGHRVDGDDIESRRAHQRLGDLQRLLAGVRLGDEQVVDIHPELSGVLGIERVFGVDDGTHAARPLRLGDNVLDQRGLARRLGAENLDDPAAWHATDAQGDVEANCARWNGLDCHEPGGLAKPHDRAFSELLLDVRHDGLDNPGLVGWLNDLGLVACCHGSHSSSRRRGWLPGAGRGRRVA